MDTAAQAGRGRFSDQGLVFFSDRFDLSSKAGSYAMKSDKQKKPSE
jgi:hypothetical protein